MQQFFITWMCFLLSYLVFEEGLCWGIQLRHTSPSVAPFWKGGGGVRWHLPMPGQPPGSPGQWWGAGWGWGWGCAASLTCLPGHQPPPGPEDWGHYEALAIWSLITATRRAQCWVDQCIKILTLFKNIQQSSLGRKGIYLFYLFSLTLLFQLLQYLKIWILDLMIFIVMFLEMLF